MEENRIETEEVLTGDVITIYNTEPEEEDSSAGKIVGALALAGGAALIGFILKNRDSIRAKSKAKKESKAIRKQYEALSDEDKEKILIALAGMEEPERDDFDDSTEEESEKE